jgi:hypothetical protein
MTARNNEYHHTGSQSHDEAMARVRAANKIDDAHLGGVTNIRWQWQAAIAPAPLALRAILPFILSATVLYFAFADEQQTEVA